MRNKDPGAVSNLVLQVAAVNVKYIRSFTSPTVIFNGNDQLLTSTPFNLGGDKYPNTKRLPFSKVAKFYIVFKAAECPVNDGVIKLAVQAQIHGEPTCYKAGPILEVSYRRN